MKKPFLIAVTLIVLAAAVYFANRPKESSTDPAPAPRPGSPAPATTAGEMPPPSPAPNTPSSPATTAAQPTPAAKDLQDPRALESLPLPLNFSGPPFERQKNGTIFKRDVVDSLSDLNDKNRDPFEDIQVLHSVVGAYRLIFQQNPVAGENREVVEALTGKNPYDLVLVDPSHPAIDAEGQLVDRWGVPYHFHPISKDHMEITSAGEDMQHGTGDDILIEDPVIIGDDGLER